MRPARMYAQAPVAPRLRQLAAEQLAADGIDATSLMVTGGALDGIERVLATWLMPSDRVIVEDPGHAVTFDLVAAMGYTAVPVPVDDLGMRPAELAAALARGAGAVIVTPRAQAATGAAWDADRAAAIGAVLRRHPSVGVIEDDHAGPVAGVPAFSVCGRTCGASAGSPSARCPSRSALTCGSRSWPGTRPPIARVAGRQALGTGWVSYQLQELVADLWADPSAARALRTAAEVYAAPRRGAALGAAGARDHRERPVRIHLLGAGLRRGRRRVLAGRGGLGGRPRAAVPHRRAARASGSRSPAWRRPTPPCSRPTSPARCGTGRRAWTEPSARSGQASWSARGAAPGRAGWS